ncbi:MAG: hypothetical protein VKQ33_15545 [Candidatus Sericytochromatia bacterium]|nr:hypothetical protein [Candidatus Sericytochromatia bacterium]
MAHLLLTSATLALTGCLLSGCLLATPATGLCLTEACQAFEAQRAALAAPEPPPERYSAPDFELIYPGEWGQLGTPVRTEAGQEEVRPLLDQTDPTGFSTLRVAVGRSIPLEEGGAVAESLRVLTINRALTPGAPPASSLEELTRLSTRQNFQDPAEVVEAPARLSNLPGYQVSVVGLPRGGGSLAMRMVARATTHRGRGYIVRLSVPEVRYTAAASLYDRVFDGFTLLDGDPTYPLPAEPAPAATASDTTPLAPPSPAASSTPAVGGPAP